MFRNELAACLTLTAPVGMTEEARRDWFAVAWETLKDIPPDILAIGARAARKKCDHPAKIVPTIVSETAEMLALERRLKEWDSASSTPKLPPPPRCTPEQASAILAELGLKRVDPESSDTSNPTTTGRG